MRHLLVDTYIHMPPRAMVEDLSAEDATARVGKAPHTIAEIVGHLHFWQGWFLKRCRGEAEPMATSAARGWPSVGAEDWAAVKEGFLRGVDEAARLGEGDLGRSIEPAIEFPAMAAYTLRDALTHVAVHNAHHLGQVVLMRQMLGLWPPPGGSWTW